MPSPSPATTSLDWAKNKETADLLRKHGGKTAVELKAERNQPTPPLERSRVGVRLQQLKRLENCAQRADRCLTVKRTPLTLAVTSLVATTSFAVPIHNAARDVDLAGVQELLNVGADVNGWTALYNAARCCG